MKITNLRLVHLLIFILLFFSLLGCEKHINPLSEEERTWIEKNNGKIRLTPDPAFPPIDFFNENGTYRIIEP